MEQKANHPELRAIIPNVIVEAMASGIPIISTRLPGVVELIREGENGLLVSPGDPKALAETTFSVMQDNRKREQPAALLEDSEAYKAQYALD